MKKKPLDIDDMLAISSKTRVHEKQPIHTGTIIVLFCLFFIVLAVCFVKDEQFTANQMSFLSIFGTGVISVFTIIMTLNNEKRSRYIIARKSALMLSDVLHSLYSQIERIKNGAMFVIVYPNDWISYYENCCAYLTYDYLPYLLCEFDVIEKLNKCIENGDKLGVKQLLIYRQKSITDWTLNFDIISATANISLFASGDSEQLPWTQQHQYQEFKKFIIENYENKIKQLTITYLNAHDGHSDALDVEKHVMDQLRAEHELQTGKYRYIAMENRAMLNAIFSVYLLRKTEDQFVLCWGELSLKTRKENT